MKNEWLIAGALFGCAIGASVSACSSTNGTGTTGTTTHHTTTSNTTDTSSSTSSSGTGGMPTASSSSSSSGTGGVTTSSSSGGTGNCSAVSTLHPPKLDAGANIYCPFSGIDGGANQYCSGGTDHCCETAAGAGAPSSCEALGTACLSGSTDWECQDPVADCTDSSKPVCCAPGATIGLGNPGCGNFAHTMHNTTCVAAGACTGIIMCTSDGECPSGQHCTPFAKAGAQVGGCM